MQINSISSPFVHNQNPNRIQDLAIASIVDDFITAAGKASGSEVMLDREVAFNMAFSVLCDEAKKNNGQLSPILQEKLFVLLHRYGSDQSYNQRQNGFIECANLMELSLLMQLNPKANAVNFQNFETIQDLLNELQNSNPGERKLEIYSLVNTLTSQAPLLETNTQQAILSDTLIKLTYCYQNMKCQDVLPYRKENADAFKMLQNTLQVVTLAVIQQVDNHKGIKAEFLYNRCSFLIGLNHKNPTSDDCQMEKINSYTSVLEAFKDFYGEESPQYKAKESQVRNMQGLNVLKLAEPNILAAKLFFSKAYELRSQLPEPAEVQKKWDHHNLLNNIATGYIHVITQFPAARTTEEVSLAIFMGKEMASFMIQYKAEGRVPAYHTSYVNALQKILEFNLSQMDRDLITTALKP
jgi:hypothetical protein